MGLIYMNSTWLFRILVDFENCTISFSQGKTRPQRRSSEAISDLFRQFWNFEILKKFLSGARNFYKKVSKNLHKKVVFKRKFEISIKKCQKIYIKKSFLKENLKSKLNRPV